MSMVLDAIQTQFVVPVVRHTDPAVLKNIVLALSQGGMKVIELTLMDPACLRVINELSGRGDLIVGAGTVTSEASAEAALAAGAKFLVSPGLNEKAVKLAQSRNVPFIPGVLTPSEIMRAQELGIDLVKLFPIQSMGGVNYIKLLRGPFPHMRWMCTGGVSTEDVGTYRHAKIFSVGIGGQLMPEAALKNQDWAEITRLAQGCLQA